MARKFEITRKLEQMKRTQTKGKFGNLLDDSVAILNLPESFHCSKSCSGCIMRPNMALLTMERREALPITYILRYIDLFAVRYGTKFITINGRGDPFHPMVAGQTRKKIAYASKLGIQSLVFTSGDNITNELAYYLFQHGTNIMLSLFGNLFVDAGFIERPDSYLSAGRGIHYLLNVYSSPSEENIVRLAFNYVVSEKDLHDPSKLVALKTAIEARGFVLVCNMDFFPDKYPLEIRVALADLTVRHSTNNTAHSTVIDGVCQMGAGSSITIAANGDIYRCPYLVGNPDGNMLTFSPEELDRVIERYKTIREYACVFRKTPVNFPNRSI